MTWTDKGLTAFKNLPFQQLIGNHLHENNVLHYYLASHNGIFTFKFSINKYFTSSLEKFIQDHTCFLLLFFTFIYKYIKTLNTKKHTIEKN